MWPPSSATSRFSFQVSFAAAASALTYGPTFDGDRVTVRDITVENTFDYLANYRREFGSNAVATFSAGAQSTTSETRNLVGDASDIPGARAA